MRNLSNALADPKTATALGGILNPETSEQGASSQLFNLKRFNYPDNCQL